jgi:hypothetical protein
VRGYDALFVAIAVVLLCSRWIAQRIDGEPLTLGSAFGSTESAIVIIVGGVLLLLVLSKVLIVLLVEYQGGYAGGRRAGRRAENLSAVGRIAGQKSSMGAEESRMGANTSPPPTTPVKPVGNIGRTQLPVGHRFDDDYTTHQLRPVPFNEVEERSLYG